MTKKIVRNEIKAELRSGEIPKLAKPLIEALS